MADRLTDEINKFEEAIRPFDSTWDRFDTRVIADLKNNLLISMVACLTPDASRSLQKEDQIGSIAFIRGALQISELDRFLAEWRTGDVTLGEFKLQPQEFQTAVFNTLSKYQDDDYERNWPDLSDFGYFRLQSWGQRNLEAITDYNALWAAARLQGFSGFHELALNRVGFEVGGGKVLRLNIFAPVLVKMEGEVATTSVRFKLSHHELLQSAGFTISYRIQDDSARRLDGGQIRASDLQLTKSSVFMEQSGLIQLPPTGTRVELLAHYGPYKSGSEPIVAKHFEVLPASSGANPRWTLLQSIVSNTRKWGKGGRSTTDDLLRRWLGLSPARPEDGDFELSVHCLLFLVGLVSVHLGSAEGVDLATIETAAPKLAILISCTTSSDIARKIDDLKLQMNRLSETLAGFTIRGAIFSPVRRDDITVGAMTAIENEEAIRLVLQPDLEEVYRRATGHEWYKARDALVRILMAPTPFRPI